MTEQQMQTICNVLSAQRNTALDQLVMKEAQIVELTEQIANLTERLAKQTMPEQKLISTPEECN